MVSARLLLLKHTFYVLSADNCRLSENQLLAPQIVGMNGAISRTGSGRAQVSEQNLSAEKQPSITVWLQQDSKKKKKPFLALTAAAICAAPSAASHPRICSKQLGTCFHLKLFAAKLPRQ